MVGLAANDQVSRDDRRRRWYVRPRPGTGGAPLGTGGRTMPALARAYLAVALVTALFCGVNVLSSLDEAARDGRVLAPWIPICKELSSWIGLMLACGLARLALRAAAPGQSPWPRFALTHLTVSIAFSGLHQTVMTWLRILVFAEHGELYRRPPLPADLLYEYRKDLLAYLIIASLFWLTRGTGAREPAQEVEHRYEEAPPAPIEASFTPIATFDIVDGAKTWRVPVADIVAVRAVRNYVEFTIGDGGTPLMRASLSLVEGALASYGFLRTHRSWLINPNHLRSLEATGSGDYRLVLGGDIQVPLSRRYPATLDRLRSGERD